MMEWKMAAHRLLLLSTLLILVARPVRASSNPDFDAVSWVPVGCGAPDLVSHSSPAAVDFAGDATFSAAYFAHDATYLYFRYRVDGTPAGPGGFTQYSWTALMQVPSGNPFQYQYQLSLNGKDDTIEVWQNTVAQDVEFSPLFHDDSEIQLFSQNYAFSNPSTVNTTPLARSIPAGDGSNFNGSGDFFVDFAFPVSVLIANGAISSPADLDTSIFFPATSTNPNNYNKGHLNCPFLPITSLALDKTVTPTAVPGNTTTPIRYTIVVRNTGDVVAKGVVIEDFSFPPFMSNPVVTVASDDPTVTWTVSDPLKVKVPLLLAGSAVTVTISGDAAPGCSDADFTNRAEAFATNAMEVSGSAVLHRDTVTELCDGADNNCDGRIDEGGDALCDDANACTVDRCNADSGCTHDAPAGCVPCQTGADCDDHDPCTTEMCAAGVCQHETPPGCRRCTTAADCDDHDPCTSEACGPDGSCQMTTIAGCQRCTTAADCDDRNRCTADACTGGVCSHAPMAQCPPPPEICNDGIDNDVDGLVDCKDADCAQAPECRPREICGNCLDDDGDGLTDYEDPDCCTGGSMPATVVRLGLRPTSKGHGNRLRMKLKLAPGAPALDPSTSDTSLQVSDASGQLFCATIAAKNWTHLGRRLYRFTDKAGAFAGGLRNGRLALKRNGTVRFRTRGRKMNLRASDGKNVHVTLRVGGMCARDTKTLRASKTGTLVFP